jgi:hypothetical protein
MTNESSPGEVLATATIDMESPPDPSPDEKACPAAFEGVEAAEAEEAVLLPGIASAAPHRFAVNEVEDDDAFVRAAQGLEWTDDYFDDHLSDIIAVFEFSRYQIVMNTALTDLVLFSLTILGVLLMIVGQTISFVTGDLSWRTVPSMLVVVWSDGDLGSRYSGRPYSAPTWR